ncbi:MarR family winged helix-turn-helix transcriptional regulator [Pseudanabaena sp. ABRG5-3]|uniref:MarR family winged helix-turn-helix transcriptional regulator n=1 Tax=Pseudanabaena sp. ABRG5-3 TaxID=685565 RepID=UPI000F83304E|nr:MarR family transcriptional regulator [Pseudanabaena sp. ABRG5-3]
MNSSHNFVSPQLCATKVMDVVPSVMRWIHTEVRQQKSTCLTIPQLRALAFIQMNPCSSLVALAEYLGVTSASTSTMVNRLVHKEFITREEHPKLRRQVILSLTPAGEEHLQQVRQISCDRLAEKLVDLSPEQLADLIAGLEELSQIFR